MAKAGKAKDVQDPTGTGADLKEALEESKSDVLEGYDNTPFEVAGVLVDEWVKQSRAYATLVQQAQVKRSLSKVMGGEEFKKSAIDEAKNIENKQLPPLFQQLGIIAEKLVDIFAGEPRLYRDVRLWLQLPRNLRKVLSRQLRGRRVDLNGIMERVDALEAEQTERMA